MTAKAPYARARSLRTVAVPRGGRGSRSGRWRRWCLRRGGCRRHGRGSVRRLSRDPARCRRGGRRSGTPRTDAHAPSPHAGAGVGNLDDRDRAFAAAGDADLQRRTLAAGRLSSACAALRTRLSSARNNWSGSASIERPRLDCADPGDRGVGGEACGFAHLGHHGFDQDHAAVGLGFLRAAIGKASTGRNRWRAPASASVSAQSAARAGPARWRAGPTTIARRPEDCAGRG